MGTLEDSKANFSQMKSSLDKLLEQEINPNMDLVKLSCFLLSLIEKMEWLDDLGDETIELYIDDIEDRIEKISKLCKHVSSIYSEHLLHVAKLVCGGVKANYFDANEDL